MFQLVHYVNRDSLGLANDFHSLGFIPEGTDLHAVANALKLSFGDADARRQSNDFQVREYFSLQYMR
jgi:aarF domain-containing kinase